jgi:hypothetical protein
MVDFSYSIEQRKSKWIFFWVAEQKIFFLERFMEVSAGKAKLNFKTTNHLYET